MDANGIPLAVRISAANRHDSKFLVPLVDAVPAIRQCIGRPRRRPAKLHADKGYDFAHCRRAVTSVKLVEIRVRREVAIGQAARGVTGQCTEAVRRHLDLRGVALA